MAEIETSTKDFVHSKLMEAIRNGDMATARWWADRKMRDEGFGQQIAHVDETPPDPKQQEAVQRMIDFFH